MAELVWPSPPTDRGKAARRNRRSSSRFDRSRLRVELEEEDDGRWIVHARRISKCDVLTYEASRAEAVKHVERLLSTPLTMLGAGMTASAEVTARVEVVSTPRKKVGNWTATAARRAALALLLRYDYKGMASMSGFVLRRGRIRLMLVDPFPALLGPVLLRRLGRLTGLRPFDLRAPEVIAVPDAPARDTLRAHARLLRGLRRERLRDARRQEVVVATRTFAGHPAAWIEVDTRDGRGHVSAGFRLHHVTGRWYFSSFSGATWSLPPEADVLEFVRAQLRAGAGTIYAPDPKVTRTFGLRRAKHEDVFGLL